MLIHRLITSLRRFFANLCGRCTRNFIHAFADFSYTDFVVRVTAPKGAARACRQVFSDVMAAPGVLPLPTAGTP